MVARNRLNNPELEPLLASDVSGSVSVKQLTGEHVLLGPLIGFQHSVDVSLVRIVLAGCDNGVC